MDNPPVGKRRRRWPLIVAAVILVPVSAFAGLWFGIAPEVPTKPIRLARDEAGRMTSVEPETPRGINFEVHAGKFRANNTMTAAATSSSSDHASFACERIVILNRSNHLLAALVGPLVVDSLKPLACIRQVEYYPFGFTPPAAELSPDVTVTLELDKLTEGGWPVSQSLDAEWSIEAFNQPPGCRHSYNDHLTPPLVAFDWNATLKHSSTTTGLNSSAAQYKQAAADIAEQIGNAFAKELKERREKAGAFPTLPPAFYPPYRAAPELRIAELGKLELMATSHGLLNHNETLWRLTADRSNADVIDDLERQLKSLGWTTQDSAKESHDYLRMVRQAATFVAYVPRTRDTTLIVEGEPALGPPKNPPCILIQYVDRMTQAEIQAAIDELLVQNAPMDAVMQFESHWSQDQMQRVLKILETKAASTPREALTLAKLHRRLKQDDKARADLSRARVLIRTVGDYSDLETEARKLAKDLGDEKLMAKPIEASELDELGFVALTRGMEVLPRETVVEQPIHFYTKTPDGKLKIVSLTITGSKTTGTSPYQLACVVSSPNSRSWQNGGMSQGITLDAGWHARFTVDQLESDQRFRVRTELGEQ